MADTFSVVIVTLGRPEKLARGIGSLIACNPAPDEVIVVDGDAEQSARPVTEQFAASSPLPIRYVTSAPGITVQRNVGLGLTGGTIVAFLDDDARVADDAFARLAEAYADPGVIGATGRVIEPTDHRVGAVGSRARRLLSQNRDGSFNSFGYPRRYAQDHTSFDVEFLPGAFMTARREHAIAVGFDEHLTGYALAEDEDFSCRLSHRGRLRYHAPLTVWHDSEGFSNRNNRNFNRNLVVNRAYLFRKNFAQPIRARIGFWTIVAMLVAHRLINRDWHGARGLLDGTVAVLRRR
jgi:GT2 family glycosyltransferase